MKTHRENPDATTKIADFLRLLISIRALILLFAALVCGTVTQAADLPVADWMERQVWFANLEASFPAGVSLTISSGEKTDPGWETVRIRELHSAGSGFDPAVSPTVAFFRVSQNREMIEWLDPISGEWDSLSAFLRSRKAEAPPKPVAPPQSMMQREFSGSGGAEVPAKTHPRELRADLTGDGKLERVQWEPMKFFDSDKFFYLRVVNAEGGELWKGPQERTMENAYVYFDSHIGSSFPQLLFDVDGDHHVELLAPEPQSDVSVTFFRRLRWKGETFRPLSSAALMPIEPDSDTLKWIEVDVSLGTWVSQFGSVTEDGLVQARVTRYTESGEWKGGAALLRFNPEGAKVVRWVHPLSSQPPQITMKNDTEKAPAGLVEGEIEGFPLVCSLAMEYSEKAYEAIRASGGELRVSLIVDQYGPQFLENEAIATLDETFALGESFAIRGIPFRIPGYRLDPERVYKLTVMILPREGAPDDLVLDVYSVDGAVDWVTSEIQGKTLAYRCKLVSEQGDPPMKPGSDFSSPTAAGGNAPYNPFADVDMEAFFAE